jgi:uncharacterized membrane protein (DUF4010 family)
MPGRIAPRDDGQRHIMTMTFESLVARLATALAIGLMVGVERGWRDREDPAGSRTAGIRTYSLSALLGAVLAVIAEHLGSPILLGTGFATYAAVFAWFKSREAQHDHDFSVTGVVAALLVFALGALCIVSDPRAAAVVGVATVALLASREFLHTALRRLTWIELRSALLLLAMTVVVLPLLPDRTVDPFGSLNPREIWMFTVLSAAISFAGYVAVKIAGPAKGILITSLGGALVSSTAVTVAFARRAAGGEPAATLAGGAALACMVSILRVLTIVAVIAPSLLLPLGPGALSGAAIFGCAGWFLLRRRDETAPPLPTAVSNPFELVPLLAFAAMFALIVLLSGWLMTQIGTQGVFVTAGIVGLVDVDVATMTAARLGGVSIDTGTAVLAILLALAVNALARVVYAMAAGPLGYSGRLAAATAAGLCVGGSAVAIMFR